jgi:hypothetical protein
MKYRNKNPLSLGRERAGERVIVKRNPLPFIHSRQGRGIFFALSMNKSGCRAMCR